MPLNEKTRLLPAVQAIYGSGHNKLRLKRCLFASAIVAVLALVAGGVWWFFFREDIAENPFLCGTTANEPGYIKLANRNDDHYFYWFFEAQHNASTAPLVIWLTGGPGGSSLLALFKENGPCRIQPNLTTETHPHSWTHEANMIWLDEPTSVGYSYSIGDDHDFNESDVSENLFWFLQGFIEKHPEFAGREFFLTGESYAGHYVPAAANYIRQQNKLNDTSAKAINLQGVAIGNGWTDPLIQFVHSHDMLDNAYNITLLDDSDAQQMKYNTPICAELVRACQVTPTNATACAEAYDFCLMHVSFALSAASTGRNPYDIRESCGEVEFGFCGGAQLIKEFLKQDAVMTYLGVNREWVGGSYEVGVNFVTDFMLPFDDDVADLLNGGVRVLLYVGDADAMCNWSGNKAWIDALVWEGQDGFNVADERPLMSADPLNASAAVVEAGAVRVFDNLALVRIFNAGHMVPTHQPAVSLDLMDKFFKNEAL